MRKIILLSLSILFATGNLFAQSLQTRTVKTGLDVPWEIIWGPDNYLWVTEKRGNVLRIRPSDGIVLNAGNINEVEVIQESGLLGMALHPDFENNPYVYVVYTYLNANQELKEKLVRFRYANQQLDLANPTVIMDNIEANNIHNGSRILFGPDGMLYFSTGDVANTSNAQNLNSPNGKIMRINPDGTFPSDNPYANRPFYSIGHRNPQGLFWVGNTFYSSEHGPSSDDEINIIEPGRNYGWPDVKGLCDTPTEQTFCAANNIKEPIKVWTPTLAVSDILYYNYPTIPEWQNSLLMCTLKEKDLRELELSSDGQSITVENIYYNNTYGRLRAICAAPDGRIFFTTSNTDPYGTPGATDDRIIELSPTTANSAPVVENVSFLPETLYTEGGDTGTIMVRISDTWGTGGIMLTANFAALGGPSAANLYDDGTHGDTLANDGVYTNDNIVPALAAPANGYNITVQATDLLGLSSNGSGILYLAGRNVWPGDANNDGIVNSGDFFLTASGYGLTGNNRPSTGITWQGYAASTSWDAFAYFQGSIINNRFLDANGDGTVNLFDIAATIINRGNTH